MHVRGRRFLTLFCAIGLGLALAGCDQGGDMSEELSPEEAEDRIQSAIDGLGESAGTLEGGDFSRALRNFLGLNSGGSTQGEWAGTLVQGLDSVIERSDDRFQFNASTGVYAWDPSTEQWVNEGSSESIVLEFPASRNATSNNATLELSQYSDTPVTVTGETVYLPTSGVGAISVEGTEVFSIDLEGADYATEEGLDVPLPRSFSLEILMAPHTHTFSLNENSSTDYDFAFDLANGDQLVVGMSVGAQLATDNYDELESTQVEELAGELRVGPDLTIPYTIEVGELAAFDDPTEEQINNRIEAAVQFEGQEIATLRYDKASEEVEVVYSDGSVEPASMYYENFLTEMETIWAGYLGGGFESTLNDLILE